MPPLPCENTISGFFVSHLQQRVELRIYSAGKEISEFVFREVAGFVGCRVPDFSHQRAVFVGGGVGSTVINQHGGRDSDRERPGLQRVKNFCCGVMSLRDVDDCQD